MQSQEYNQLFIETYKTFFPKLVRFTNFYIGDLNQAEDLVQDLFSDLWYSKMELIASLDNVDAFLMTVTKNRCIDYLRGKIKKRQAKKQRIDDVEGKELALKLYSINVLNVSEWRLQEIELLLKEAISHLPPRCQEVFRLKRQQGLKNKEIAQQLNISVSTVENQMTIAIKKISNELKEYLPILFFFSHF